MVPTAECYLNWIRAVRALLRGTLQCDRSNLLTRFEKNTAADLHHCGSPDWGVLAPVSPKTSEGGEWLSLRRAYKACVAMAARACARRTSPFASCARRARWDMTSRAHCGGIIDRCASVIVADAAMRPAEHRRLARNTTRHSGCDAGVRLVNIGGHRPLVILFTLVTWMRLP